MALPKLDRNVYEEQMRAKFERTLREVADPEFRRRGWQIGSGPTESECKTTTQRVKGRGRCWDGVNAEAMIAKPLWSPAMKMADAYGIHRTARALRINYYTLKKRMERETSTNRATNENTWMKPCG